MPTPTWQRSHNCPCTAPTAHRTCCCRSAVPLLAPPARQGRRELHPATPPWATQPTCGCGQPSGCCSCCARPCWTRRRPAGEAVYDCLRGAAPWARLLEPEQTFSVEARVWSCSNLSSSQVGRQVEVGCMPSGRAPALPCPACWGWHGCRRSTIPSAEGACRAGPQPDARAHTPPPPQRAPPQLLQVRSKDALCDEIRDRRGTKPAPPRARPRGRLAALPDCLPRPAEHLPRHERREPAPARVPPGHAPRQPERGGRRGHSCAWRAGTSCASRRAPP